MMSNDDMNGLMDATVDATEEAIINALVAAKTMTGANGSTIYAIPHDQVRDILRKYEPARNDESSSMTRLAAVFIVISFTLTLAQPHAQNRRFAAFRTTPWPRSVSAKSSSARCRTARG